MEAIVRFLRSSGIQVKTYTRIAELKVEEDRLLLLIDDAIEIKEYAEMTIDGKLYQLSTSSKYLDFLLTENEQPILLSTSVLTIRQTLESLLELETNRMTV